MKETYRIDPEHKLLVTQEAEELPPDPWLVLSPHPDDESIGLGGILAKGAKEGKQIHILHLTSGEKNADPTLREGEALKAASLLGIPDNNVSFARLPDGKLKDNIESIVEILNDFFDKLQPYTIFVPSPVEYHPDHRATFAAFSLWAKQANPDYNRLMAVYSISRQFDANYLVCIDDVVSLKVKAIRSYRSQEPLKRYIRTALSINAASAYGLEKCKLAEPLVLLPVPEHFRVAHHLLKTDKEQELEEYIDKLKVEIWSEKQKASQREKELTQTIDRLSRTLDQEKKHREELEKSREELAARLTSELLEKDKEIEHLHQELEFIKNTLWFRIANRYFDLKNRMLPEGTLRRRVYDAFRKGLYIASNEGILSLADYAAGKWKNILVGMLKSRINGKYHVSFPLNGFKICGPSNDNFQEVTAVSVLYNNPEYEIRQLVETLNNSSITIRELILIDNSKDRRLEEVIQSIRSPYRIRYLKSNRNIGFGRGVNIGISEAQTDLVLVINPDTKVERDCIEHLAKVLLSKEEIALAEAMQVPYEHPKFYNPVTLQPVWASGCCFMVKRKAFLSVGGFDENIFLYAEDVDLSWRLKAKGYELKYVPRAKVWHDPHKERSALNKYAPVSNLYLRIKYGASISNWLMLNLLSGRTPVNSDALSIFLKGVKERKKIRPRAIGNEAHFDPTSFGYEPLRRRGAEVPILNMQEEPLISVIVRTHNRPQLLKRALTTLCNQSYKNIEVVVVEDKTELANDVLSEFPALRIKYLKVKEGRTRALNAGMSSASGDFIMFLDDDDMLFGDAIEILLSHALNEGADFVYAGGLQFETDDKVSGTLFYGYMHEFNREKLMKENFIPMGSFIISTDLARSVGNFDETLEYLEDWDFIRRAAKKTDFLFIPKDILIYCVPMDKRLFWKRQAKLDAAYSRVVSKDLIQKGERE